MLAIYTSVAFSTASGLALAPNASIEVRLESTGALASLFSDEAGTAAKANPFNAAADGSFSFYVAGLLRGYQVKSTYNAEVVTLHNQAIGTAAQLDAAAVGQQLLALATIGKGGVLTGRGSNVIAEHAAPADATVRVADAAQTDGWQDVPLAWAKNPLINGCFRINQRLPATNADDTYAHDRWYALTQTGTIALSTLTDVENGTPHMARLTQSQASAQRMGYAQIIEGKNCKYLRGRQVTFRFGRMRLSSSDNVRIAVLEWTGTEDAVTSDVVNSWTNGTFTAGQFFLASNLTVSGVVQQALTAATLANGSPVTVTLGSSFNNLIVFAWTENAVAQNVTLDLGKAQLEIGSLPSEFERRSYGTELQLCQRYFEMSFPLGTAPAQNAGATGCANFGISAAGAGARGHGFTFRANKRVAPTMTSYNPVAANNKANDPSFGDLTAPSFIEVGDGGFNMSLDTTGSSSGRAGRFHWTADAEL